MEYTEIELKHAKLLEEMSVMCRSSKNSFTITDRLDVIREKLAGTGYAEYAGDADSEHPSPYSLWSKVAPQELPSDVILISTHADIVPSITQCSSTLDDNGFYTGTYDNIGTNAAAVLLMLEHDLPDNVVVAFTGDEETGRCKGAKGVAKYLSSLGKNLTCVALDVTYEGFWDNRLCSIENCTAPKDYPVNFANEIANIAISTENEQSFCFVAADTDCIPSELDKKYLSENLGMYDEAFAYRDKGHPSLSFCLPCNGSMHSNSGVRVKQPVFEGYVISLASFVYEITRTHPQLVEAYKVEKDKLVQKATEIRYIRPAPAYEKPIFSSPIFHNFDYDDDYEDDEPCQWNDVDAPSSLISMLYAKAVTYDPDDLELFVQDTEIPYEYMDIFCSDPDGAILPDEEKKIETFLRGLFDDVHHSENLEQWGSFECNFMEQDCNIDDEYYKEWLSRLEEEKQMLSGYHDEYDEY